MDELIAMVPNGAQYVGLIVAVAALISALVPDDKLPPWLAKILNAIALNVGAAKNAPNPPSE